MEREIKGIGVMNDSGPVVLVNMSDVTDYLRDVHHELPAEVRGAVDQLADIFDMVAREILHRDLGL